ncbi:Serine/threonine-protein kinase A [Halomicronema hongdechloris C2206]|uniref:Serine/threonine-protein kinase A n=1 Tax=Halomicronema hongdechloris C2206 TaxID=1641165 RepID=A0A1Z3HV68_9CYAN|nr:serine/threonine-protein kinase [Halomicronema hongdechloris]ASC74211.1 Serine/threonine-protein kinase A [Halomicronema hongdechloris C2206]
MAESTTDPNLGRKLANRYELVEPIGQGSMGKVYLADDTLLGNVKVAVKFLSQTLLNHKMQERFVQEAMTCAQLGLNSIHVVRVTDYGVSDDGIPFYVMEYLRGQSLSHLINLQPLPVPRFLGLTRQICLGLKTAHDGILLKGQQVPIPIIHRDIKPSNILITQDPTLGELAKVLDFGIAKLMQSDGDQTNCFMGTLAYASPEQMEGQELDRRSDIYSLGIMMFQMLTGKLPLRANSHTFGGWYKVHHSQTPQTLTQADPQLKVPKRLDTLIMTCLKKKPEQRPQTIMEILEALEPLEQRFGGGFRIGQRIGATLSRVPVTRQPEVSDSLPKAERICRLTSWPKTKPVAEIVFPHPLPTSSGSLATLWAMMPQREIERRLISTRYNTFICTLSPHPMALWLTALFSSQHGPRWLPCYLDLKASSGQEMAFLLGRSGEYKLLLFALEAPQRCAHVLNCHIEETQKKLLQEWVMAARVHPSVGSPSDSKDLLRTELNQRLKPKVERYLNSLYSEAGSEISE